MFSIREHLMAKKKQKNPEACAYWMSAFDEYIWIYLFFLTDEYCLVFCFFYVQVLAFSVLVYDWE